MALPKKKYAALLEALAVKKTAVRQKKPRKKRQFHYCPKPPTIRSTATVTEDQIEIVIYNWRPATLNELLAAHRMEAGKLKRRDRDVLVYTALSLKLPKAVRKRRVTLHLILPPRGRKCDPDAFWKSTLDGLVHAGLLVDDRHSCVELAPVEYSRGPVAATKITLVDIP